MSEMQENPVADSDESRESDGPDDLDPETKAKFEKEVRQFLDQFGAKLSELDPSGVRGGSEYGVMGQAGHDLWLTQGGHGVGFLDGDWPEPLDKEMYEYSEGSWTEHGIFFLGNDNQINFT